MTSSAVSADEGVLRPRQHRYVTIAAELRSELEGGDLAPGSLLPPESQLSETYGVSRITVRKALKTLQDEGLVESRQGYGWLVGQPAQVPRRLAIGSYEQALLDSGANVEWHILHVGLMTPSRRVSERLDSERALFVKRLTVSNGSPTVLLSMWIPELLAESVTPTSLQSPSFSTLVRRPVERAIQSLRARAASADEADLLRIPVGSPVMHCERVSSDADGVVLNVAAMVYPADAIEFVVDVPHGVSEILPTGTMPHVDGRDEDRPAPDLASRRGRPRSVEDVRPGR